MAPLGPSRTTINLKRALDDPHHVPSNKPRVALRAEVFGSFCRSMQSCSISRIYLVRSPRLTRCTVLTYRQP